MQSQQGGGQAKRAPPRQGEGTGALQLLGARDHAVSRSCGSSGCFAGRLSATPHAPHPTPSSSAARQQRPVRHAEHAQRRAAGRLLPDDGPRYARRGVHARPDRGVLALPALRELTPRFPIFAPGPLTAGRLAVQCTRDYCPMVNATRDWLRMGGWRIDTGYPFGDRCVTAASLLCSGLSCSPATAAAARPTATRSG